MYGIKKGFSQTINISASMLNLASFTWIYCGETWDGVVMVSFKDGDGQEEQLGLAKIYIYKNQNLLTIKNKHKTN